MAAVTKTIKSSGGDYTTAALWEAAIPPDQPQADPWEGHIQEAFDVGSFVWDVSNANSAPHLLTVDSGYRYSDQANWPSCGAVEGQGGRIVLSSESGKCISVYTVDVIVSYLEVASTGTGSSIGIMQGGSGSAAIQHCLIRDCTRYGVGWSNSGAGMATVSNCFIYGCDYGTSYVVSAYNNTVFSCTSYGIHSTYSAATIKNNIALDNGTDFSVSASATKDYNLSSDATAPGTTVWTNKTSSDIIVNTTAGSEDLHLKSTNDGTYEGSDESATIGSLDIDGDTRTDWDIGADELVGGGGGGIAVLRRRREGY